MVLCDTVVTPMATIRSREGQQGTAPLPGASQAQGTPAGHEYTATRAAARKWAENIEAEIRTGRILPRVEASHHTLFVGFFYILNLIANTPVSLDRTANDSPAIRSRVAVKASLTRFAMIVVSCLFGALTLSSGRAAVAAEGASSNYFPGSYGTVAAATPPTAGWTYLNYNLFFAAGADRAVLQGRLNVGLDTFAVLQHVVRDLCLRGAGAGRANSRWA